MPFVSDRQRKRVMGYELKGLRKGNINPQIISTPNH